MSDTTTLTIGGRRAALRTAAGLSPIQLAAKAEVSLATVMRAENGDPLQERVIRLLAAALDCPPADYLG